MVNQNIALQEGKLLPLMEEFYSIQGEGYNTGKAAYFIRLGGCDVGCRWCDVKESWNPSKHPPTPTKAIVANIIACKAKAVVITGGEPMMYNLNPLCEELKSASVSIFIESSGAYPLSGNWDWLCISPKRQQAPLPNTLMHANEIKVVIQEEDDLLWAEENATKAPSNCLLYLQPEWSKANKIMPLLTNYVMQHPKWRISIQTHKYMGIP